MCTTFGDDRLRGLGVARGRISHFPIDLRRRPYNSRTTVQVCEILYHTRTIKLAYVTSFYHLARSL